jgi:hypothetical protein
VCQHDVVIDSRPTLTCRLRMATLIRIHRQQHMFRGGCRTLKTEKGKTDFGSHLGGQA